MQKIVLVVFLAFSSSFSMAQNFLGAWGGGGQSYFIDVPVREGFKSNPRYGIMAIGIVSWQNQLGNSDFYFHTGFDWEQRGGRNITERSSDSSYFKYDIKYRFTYLTVPLQMAYHLRISKSFRIIVAPGVGISRLALNDLEWYRNDNGKEDWGKGSSEVSIRNEGDENGWEIGFLGNAMLQVKVADYLWLNGGYRYYQGLTRLYDKDSAPNNETKNLSKTFFIGIAYNTSALY